MFFEADTVAKQMHRSFAGRVFAKLDAAALRMTLCVGEGCRDALTGSEQDSSRVLNGLINSIS